MLHGLVILSTPWLDACPSLPLLPIKGPHTAMCASVRFLLVPVVSSRCWALSFLVEWLGPSPNGSACAPSLCNGFGCELRVWFTSSPFYENATIVAGPPFNDPLAWSGLGTGIPSPTLACISPHWHPPCAQPLSPLSGHPSQHCSLSSVCPCPA